MRLAGTSARVGAFSVTATHVENGIESSDNWIGDSAGVCQHGGTCSEHS
jgi:hypothetical protein